ncbi:hypothetical protein V8C86DRAFT_2666877 [Haematococcus lacustris]
MRAFLRTTVDRGPSNQTLTRTLTLTNWDDFARQEPWTSGSLIRVQGTRDPQFPVRITVLSVTLLRAGTPHWAKRFNAPDARTYAALYQTGNVPVKSDRRLQQQQHGGRRQATAVRPGLSVLVVRVSFPDGCWAGPGATCSKATWTEVLMGSSPSSVNSMVSACTFNGITLGGLNVTNDVLLPCPARAQTCDDLFAAVADAANNALSDTVVRAYDHVMYDVGSQAANFGDCNWLAAAGVGEQWIWMNGNCYAGTAMHEMGHNYHLWHSGALDTDGQVQDYNDMSCIMGYQTSWYTPYNDTDGTGGDIKCFSAPQLHQLGLARFPVISPSRLGPGAVIYHTLFPHWTGPSQALRLTGWGGSDFFLSYQYDGGPNIALSGEGGLQAVVLVHQYPVISDTTQDTINFRHMVLGYGLTFELPGTSLVVRIHSLSEDHSSVTVSICRKSSSQACTFANAAPYIGPEYLRLRTTANPTWCLAVCSTAAGSECQPSGWSVDQQRAIVLKREGCNATDDWSLWSVMGNSLRNKATGWCMDASLVGSLNEGWGMPIIARPCSYSTAQSFTWRVQPGSIRTGGVSHV